MTDPQPVNTRIGMVDRQIILAFDQELDTVKYPLDAAEEVATKMLELIKSVRDSDTNP